MTDQKNNSAILAESTRRDFLRFTGGAVVEGALLSGTSRSTRAQTSEAWPQFGYDNLNTGHAPDNTAPVADISQQWSFKTGNLIGSSPAIANGTIYVGSNDGNMYALNAEDGTKKWSFETDDGVSSSPAVVDGTVYVGSSDWKVYALDAGDGTKKWSYQTRYSVFSSPAVAYDTVYIGSNDDNVYALDAGDGTEQWRFETSDPVWSSPAVINGTVYVGSNDGNVYALNAGDGTEQWHFETGAAVDSSPAVTVSTVYIGSRDHTVYALNAEDGTEQWAFVTGLGVRSSPAVVDSTVYVGSRDNTVYGLDAADGTKQWTFQTGDSIWSSPAVVDGTVYVGSMDDNVYALDAGDGTEQWTFQIGDGINPMPAVADSTVYIGSNDKRLYALAGKAILQTPSTPSPTPPSTPSPTPPSTPSPTPPSTPSPTPDSVDPITTDQADGNQVEMPILTLVLGILGVSGVSAWWYRRRDGSDTGTNGGPSDSGSAGGTTGSSATETRSSDRSSGTPSGRNSGLPANQTSTTTSDTPATSSKKDHRQQLQDDVESLRSALNRAETLADSGHLERSKEQLTELESHLISVKQKADQHDFADLYGEITSLERQRKKRLKEVTEQLKAYPIPDEIPRAPTISVDYDALTDKEPIGAGGNADVIKATLPTPDGDVTLAIKEPRLSGTLHTDQVERMLNEAKTWDQLDDHDHIVGVVDYGSQPIPWIAMEYMDGGHLGEWRGEMEFPRALWTAIAVTKGVRHAHRRGVAHLDLKPENVLFRTVEDAWDVPKVADWGLSKHLLDHSKSIEGYTPTYSAPEQLDNEYGPADDITDIYQLGAVFYELFTGKPPFDGDSTGQIVRQVLAEEPTPPSEIANVPEQLDDILLKALAKQKDHRYEDILLLRNALQELFDEW